MGANDQGSVGKIQGPTLSGAYVDEMALLPQNFIDMLLSRLSKPHSKLFATMNPDSPYHPIKTNLIDRADGKDIYALHFNLDDNPILTEDFKNRLKKLYSGLWYRRFILGEWCMAEGAIYDFFDRKFHVHNRAPTFGKYYLVGVDYGTSNPFAAVLIGVNPNNSPAMWVEKEYYWDPKETGRQKTDTEFADQIQYFIEGYPVKFVYLDPSAQSMEVELKNRKLPVKQAANDVLNGIRLVARYLSQGDLVICSQAVNLIKEIEGYRWDMKKCKIGEDAPIKDRDHACDALRYAIFTHFGIRTKIKQETLPERPNNLMDTQGFGDGHGWQSFGGGNSMFGGRK